MTNQFDLKWLEDKTTFEITATIPKKEIKKEYQTSLKLLAKNTTLPGFRKGKAPLPQVEQKLGKKAIYQQLIKRLIPQVYQKAISEHQLKPIAEPKVTLTSAQENRDWVIKITSCVLPEIKLGKYEQEVKKINAGTKIWTPGKDSQEPSPEEKKAQEQKRLSQILEKLNQTIKFELPSFLIESELQKRMVSLIDQLQKTSLTIDQYLATKGQTIKQLRQEVRQQIETEWKLELALEKIANQEKIKIDQEEINKIAKAEAKKKDVSPVNPYLLARFLRRQKTLEFLLNL